MHISALQDYLSGTASQYCEYYGCAESCFTLRVLVQNGTAPKVSHPEEAAKTRRATRKVKQPAAEAAAKEEAVEASAADADKLEAALPKRRAKKRAAAAQEGALTHSYTWLLPQECLYSICPVKGVDELQHCQGSRTDTLAYLWCLPLLALWIKRLRPYIMWCG